MFKRLIENPLLRVCAVIAALGAAGSAFVQFWPSPSTDSFTSHVAADYREREALEERLSGKLLKVAASSDRNTIYRITTQQVLIDDALERAKSRGDRQRVIQLEQQRRELKIELHKMIERQKEREKRNLR